MATAAYSVAILAGGLATRLRPLTQSIPKALIDVGGDPFILWQLRLAREQGVKHVVVCAGYRGDMIRDAIGHTACGLDVDYVFDWPTLLGTAGALKRALGRLEEAFFVLYGDSYVPCAWPAVQRAFDTSGRLALMTLFRNDDAWDRSNVEFRDGRIVTYDKHRRSPRMRHIDYGLGLFRRAAFDDITEGQPYDLTDLYGNLLARGEVTGYEVLERFYEIGSWDGLKEMRALVASGALVRPPTVAPRGGGA